MTPEEIKQLRERADLTQTELANILSVNRSAVGQWEAGVTQPGETQKEVLKAIRREVEKRKKKEFKKIRGASSRESIARALHALAQRQLMQSNEDDKS